MLLRWIVNQYLHDVAPEKVREVVGQLARSSAGNITEPSSGNLTPAQVGGERSPADEFLPCDAAFIFALGIEAGGLVDLLQQRETSRHRHGTENAGKLAGREVVVMEGGVGPREAARATAEAIKFYKPRWVVSAGFAGALDERLRRGHILMADEVVGPGKEALAVGMRLDSQSVAATKGLHVGRLLTVDEIVRRPEQRKKLAEEHGAIACDMETFAVAEVCRHQQVPLLAIRIISDAVDDELPPEIEHLLMQRSLAGKLGAAANAILQRFSAAKDLWKLREDALKASDRLAKFLAGITQQLPTSQ